MDKSRHGLLAVVLLGMASLANAGPVRALLGQGAAAGVSSTSIAAGNSFSCELIGDGTVRCWGTNLFGQLGNGASGVAFNSTPVQVSGLTDAVGLGAGLAHACALTAGGIVACWGDNSIGQLAADPETVPMRSTPTAVANLTNAVALSVGAAHSCALKSDGTAVCWGASSDGQLGGEGSAARPTYRATPVDGLSNAVGLAAGGKHTCALLADGTVSCWGRNTSGQLGDGTIRLGRSRPAPVVDLTNVVSLAAGEDYTCAHRAGGTVRCWGANNLGQLGDGTLNSSPVPVTTGGIFDPAAISAGKDGHTCILRSDSSVRCWGRNVSGQLGNGVIASPQTTAVTVSGLTNAVALAAGSTHTCALTVPGGTVCWGNNDFGQLGDGSANPSLTPVSAAITRSISAVQLVSGSAHNCALRSDGNVACWGSNASAELAQATALATSPTPVAVAGLSGGAVVLGAGSGFGCALRVGGTVSCWGQNTSGQLGRGTLSSAEPTPAPVSELSSVVALSEGSNTAHACAVEANGRTRCWGSNLYGQLGDGTTVSPRPKPVIADTKGAIQVVVGNFSTCLLYTSGTVACTGANNAGQLGDGTTNPRSNLDPVSGLSNVIALAAGGEHVCALQANGTIRCWGKNIKGQLGTGTTSSFSSVPVAVVGVSGAVAITAQYSSTCALLADGTARCWGENDVGQLGDGTVGSPRLSPQAVTISVPNATGRLASLLSVSGGDRHGCALQSSGAPFCWGSNKSSQAGGPISVSVTRAQEMPSFRFNISPVVALRSPGRVATVTALLNCPEDQQAKVEITLRQGSVVGNGIGMRKCAGGIDRYEFTVPARGREPFVAGPAEVQAEAVVLERGTPIDTQTWTRKVTVSVTP